MDRWIIYLQERFSLPSFASLAAGISLSGIYLAGGAFRFFSFVFSFVGILLCFALMRLMEDVKNLEKDRIAYPDRTLARGVIEQDEAVRTVGIIQLILFAYSMIVWVVLQEVAALTYACIAIFLWLSYRDYYLRQWLNRHLVLHGILRQLIVFPVVLFAVAASKPLGVLSSAAWSFGMMMSAAFFCCEICRNLDPHAHPVLGTYVHFFGYRRTFELATIALAISCIGAIALGLWPILLPCQLVVLITLFLPFFHQEWYYIPDIAASISLMAHAWSAVFAYTIFS